MRIYFSKLIKLTRYEEYSDLTFIDCVVYSELLQRKYYAQQNGSVDERGAYFRVSYDEIAIDYNSSRSAMYKSVKRLVEHGLVEVEKGKVRVDPKFYVKDLPKNLTPKFNPARHRKYQILKAKQQKELESLE